MGFGALNRGDGAIRTGDMQNTLNGGSWGRPLQLCGNERAWG